MGKYLEGDKDGVYGIMDKRSVEDVVGGREVVENYKSSRKTLYNKEKDSLSFKNIIEGYRDYLNSRSWN